MKQKIDFRNLSKTNLNKFKNYVIAYDDKDFSKVSKRIMLDTIEHVEEEMQKQNLQSIDFYNNTFDFLENNLMKQISGANIKEYIKEGKINWSKYHLKQNDVNYAWNVMLIGSLYIRLELDNCLEDFIEAMKEEKQLKQCYDIEEPEI